MYVSFFLHSYNNIYQQAVSLQYALYLLKVFYCLVVVTLLLYKLKIYISSCISLHLLILTTSLELNNKNYTHYTINSIKTFSLSFLIPSKICSTCFKNRSLFFSVFIALLCSIIVQYTMVHCNNIHVKILVNLIQDSKLHKTVMKHQM